MNHSIKLSDTLTFPGEFVSMTERKYIGTQQTALVKARFKADNGKYFEFMDIDFMGQAADLTVQLKPGRKYLVTFSYRGRPRQDDKLWPSFVGEMISAL